MLLNLIEAYVGRARAMPTRPSRATAISTAMTDADSSTIGSLVTDQAP